MDYWNFTFIMIGIVNLVGGFARLIFKCSYSEKYFNKLEKKFGNIDRAKIIKLDNIYTTVLGLIFIVTGLLIKDKDIALVCLISMIVGMLVLDYFIRKKYIVIDKL